MNTYNWKSPPSLPNWNILKDLLMNYINNIGGISAISVLTSLQNRKDVQDIIIDIKRNATVINDNIINNYFIDKELYYIENIHYYSLNDCKYLILIEHINNEKLIYIFKISSKISINILENINTSYNDTNVHDNLIEAVHEYAYIIQSSDDIENISKEIAEQYNINVIDLKNKFNEIYGNIDLFLIKKRKDVNIVS